MKYSVIKESALGQLLASESVKSEKAAVKLAKQWASEVGEDEAVYIQFYRATDGQHGYINPNGAGISGMRW